MRTLLALLLLVTACATVSAAEPGKPRFTDVSAASGLRIAAKTGVGGTNPHAVAVEDFDGDGLLDVIIPTFGQPHVYYFRNKGQLRFEDVTKGSGLESFAGDGTGAAVADFDRDGKLDVYLTSVRGGASRLYRNKGDGAFEDVSEKAGTLIQGPARSCAWSDVDGDGWPDLFVCCPQGPNFLFRNNRDGSFRNIAKMAGVELVDRQNLGCAFGDADGDGIDDLFVSSYQSQVSSLFKASRGRQPPEIKFQDISVQAGLDRRASSVGCVFADVFNRGRLDLFVTTDSWLSGANYSEAQLLQMKHTVEPNVLYVNDGAGKFTILKEPLFDLKTLGHDVVAEDFDHDGWLDLYVAVDAESGNQWATSKGGNRLYTRPDGKAWQEASKPWGIHQEANCVCTAAADFDNDGDLDLLLVNFYTQPVVYRNETNDKNWLRVKVAGSRSSRDGIGAKVSLFQMDGGKKTLVGFRQVQSGSGYCRSSPVEAHFGLGTKPAGSYRLEVLFPGAKKPVVKDDIQAGGRVRIGGD